MNKIKRFIVTNKLKKTKKDIERKEASLDSLKVKFEETAEELATYKELAVEKGEDKTFKRKFSKVMKKASKASEKYNNTISRIENLKLQTQYYQLDLEGNLHELHSDIMRYKNNSASFWFCILAIVCNVAMFLIIYKTTNCTPNVQLGIDLLINVLVLLAAFLIAERTKAYNKNGAYGAIGLGVVEILRIFWIPLFYFTKYMEYLKVEDKGSYTGIIGLDPNGFTWCCILLTAAGVCLIFAGIICLAKGKRLQDHLKNLEGGK
jgi:mRNA-degrading endonuclease YafQ of YafQ-DinJ toxin-antitoxin module